MTNDNKNKQHLLWEKVWLKEFFTLDSCDQKVLAVLYWEDLTDKQKAIFSDADYIEHQKYNEMKKQEIMLDPTKMRQHFLKSAAPVLDNMLEIARGDKTKSKNDEWATREVWEVLKTVITTANDPAPLINLKGKSITDQIDAILTKVSEQKITINEAKEYMSLVSSGFNLQQLPQLLAKLEALEAG